MIDVKNAICNTPLCDKHSQIDGKCIRCFYALNPNDKRCKRIKLKENEVVKYIKQEFNELNWIFDMFISGDGLCFNVRPDALLHLNNHSLIIEIDENQHKFYDVSCDEARTHKIQEALDRPIIIIRFNPDEYIDNNKQKIKSCFKVDKKLGLTIIPKNEEENWNDRLKTLKKTILENLIKISENPIKIIKLYYDEFDCNIIK